jgi:hypothetical protein
MKRSFLLFLLLACFINFLGAEEIIVINDNDIIIDTRERDNERNNNRSLLGLTFSFGGFKEYRLGMGLFFENFRGSGSRRSADDFGLLAEYNLKENIKHARLYYHMTDGSFGLLMGGSVVMAFVDDDMAVGFAPEIGFGLASSFKVFYRYNFYLDDKFNSHEIVFHIGKGRNLR